MTNVLIIPERNEKLKPLNVIERGLSSDSIDEIYVIDGWSTDGTETLLQSKIPKLQKKFKKKIKLFHSGMRNTGKGGAMITGIKKALQAYHSKILFLDADITSVSPAWCDLLVKGVDKHKVDLVKGTFDRAPFDAQITRHITRPLISMYFPEGRNISQPLGGELCMTKDLAKDMISMDVAPTHTWGIDTFFTINSLTQGYKVAEQYLCQKSHNKKSTSALREMLIECFDEAAKLIYYHNRHVEIPQVKKNLVKHIGRKEAVKRIGIDVRTMQYTEPSVEVENFLGHVNNLTSNGIITSNRINNVPLSKFADRLLFLDLMYTRDAKKFKEKSKKFGKAEWIRTLDVLTRKYIHFNFATRYYELIYLLWKVRSLCFMTNEAKTFDMAERNTAEQSKLAFDFAQNIHSTI